MAGSLIQGQALANITGTQLPTPTKEQANTTASTLAGILGGVTQGVQQYQAENKDRLLALGANDQLTGATRDVNFLDAKNYTFGREYQKVAQLQAQSKQEYQAQIKDLVKQGATYDDLEQAQKTYLDTAVNTIAQSNLPKDLQTKLYEDNLANQLVYSKMIKDAITTQNKENEANTSLTNSAVLYQSLSGSDLSDDEANTLLTSFLSNSRDAKSNAGYDPKEAKTMATRELQGVMQHWISDIDPTTADGVSTLNRYSKVRNLLERSGQIDMDTLTSLDNTYGSKKQLLTTHNENVFSIDLNNDATAFALGTKKLDQNWVQDKLSNLNKGMATGVYSENYLVTQGSKIQGIVESEMKKQAEGKVDPMVLANSGITLSDFSAQTGKSEEAYSGYLQRSLENTLPNNLFGQGMSMITKGIQGDNNSQALPSLIKNGVQKVTSTFDSYLLAPQNAVTNDDTFAERNRNFIALRDQYRKLRDENSPQATALLGSLDSRTASVITQVFESNGTLGDAINLAKSPVTIEQKSKNVQSAISKLNTDTLNLSQYFQSARSTVSTGSVFSGGGEDLRPVVESLYRAKANASQSTLLPDMSDDSPNALVGAMKRNGMVVASPNSHNDAVFDAQTGNWLRNFSYKGVKLNTVDTYSGKATDTLRDRTAKQFNISPDNVLITNEGNMIVARPYDKKTGTLVSGVVNGRSASNGVPYTRDEFAKLMRDAYDSDANIQASKVKSLSVTGGSGTFNYSSNAFIGTTTLNALGGRSQVVNTPSGILVGTNGNTLVASQIMALRNRFEGYVSNSTAVKGQGTSTSGNVIGWGIRQDAHPKTFEAMRNNANNPQAQMQIQSAFDSGYYKDLPKFGVKVGIPVLDQKLPVKFNISYALMADYMWHGGIGSVIGGKGIANTLQSAMSQPTYAQGLAILKQTHPYRASKNPDTDRRSSWYREALRSHYNALGRP